MIDRRIGVMVVVAACGITALVGGCEKKAPTPSGGAATPSTPQPTPAPAPAPAPEAPATNPIGSPAPTPPAPPPAAVTAAPKATRDGSTLSVAGLSMTIPENWKDMEVGAGMFPPAARFSIDPVPGDTEPVTIGIFAGIKGTVEANMNRWLIQVTRLESRPDRQELKVGDLTVHQLVASGAFNPTMPGQPQQASKDNWMILGAIVQGGPDGDVHILARGPKSTLLRSREAWDAFVQSLKLAE